jgi:medium-chain acyl-[acyl-carrier-protein] hydrolase
MITSSPKTNEKPTSDWMVFPKPNLPAAMRLFCFPYAGAGSMVYRTWPEGLPPQVEVVSILYPGRESRLRVPRIHSMKPLISALAAEIIPFLDRPFAFFGHSLGGLIAFELARELRRRHHPLPSHFFISSRRAPQLHDPLPPIASLENDAFALAVQRRYNGIPKIIQQDPELMEIFLPILKADFSVLETYEYIQEPAFDIGFSTYIGIHDTIVTLEDISAWQVHTNLPVSSQTFTGDHFYLQSQRLPLLQSLSLTLEKTIEGRG